MKPQYWLCVTSAALGAALTALIGSFDLETHAAQETPGTVLAAAPRTSIPSAKSIVGDGLPDVDDELTAEERVNVDVYEAVNFSVVNIDTSSVRSDGVFLYETPSQGAGSGSVLDKNGHILTNFHVIDKARTIQVTLYDGTAYEAQLVGKDRANDMAVLKIDAPKSSLVPVELGDSARLRVGQRVFAIGNPFGLQRTLTTGIVSSLDRTLPVGKHRTIKSIIQTDAAINPGNSGGPLLDTRGRLIGMNTAIFSRTGQNSGIGFAIPVTNIARVVPQLIKRGRVVRPDAGITQFMETERGLVVVTTAPDGPAARAGLRGFKVVTERRQRGNTIYEVRRVDRSEADLIVAVDGKRVRSASDFLSVVEAFKPGDQVVFTVVRQGRSEKVPVTLVENEG